MHASCFSLSCLLANFSLCYAQNLGKMEPNRRCYLCGRDRVIYKRILFTWKDAKVDEWSTAMGIDAEWVPPDRKICDMHFAPSHIELKGYHKLPCLTRDAVPFFNVEQCIPCMFGTSSVYL